MKFRVWHKKLQRFLAPEEWVLGFNGELFFVDVRAKNCLIACSRDIYTVNRGLNFVDNSGKDIYEGDIIEVRIKAPYRNIDKLQCSAVVSWDKERNSFFLKPLGALPLNSPCFDTKICSSLYYRYNIIGNIYENEDLFYKLLK